MKRIFVRIFLVMMLAMIALPAIASTQTDRALPAADMFTGMLVAGMIVNAASLAALFKNFNTIFNQALSAYQPQWNKIAMEVPSNTASENYSWLGAFPKMREWVGDRQIKNLIAQTWTIPNKEYEDTVAVKRTTIEDDQYGVFSPIIRAQAAAAAALWDDLVFDLLNNGFTALGYDGKAFFATTHDSGSNKDSGGSSALSTTSFGTAIGKIKRTKDSASKPLFNGTEAITLIVPPELEETAKKILNADYISVASGSTQNNMWKNAASLIVSPKITSSTAWFLTIDFNGLRALIAQVRQQPEFVAKEDPQTSDHVFMRNEYLYGTYARGNGGYGLHQLAYGSVGA